jgi:hypothetical protein
VLQHDCNLSLVFTLYLIPSFGVFWTARLCEESRRRLFVISCCPCISRNFFLLPSFLKQCHVAHHVYHISRFFFLFPIQLFNVTAILNVDPIIVHMYGCSRVFQRSSCCIKVLWNLFVLHGVGFGPICEWLIHDSYLSALVPFWDSNFSLFFHHLFAKSLCQ